jgi:hypothetical protein
MTGSFASKLTKKMSNREHFALCHFAFKEQEALWHVALCVGKVRKER